MTEPTDSEMLDWLDKQRGEIISDDPDFQLCEFDSYPKTRNARVVIAEMMKPQPVTDQPGAE